MNRWWLYAYIKINFYEHDYFVVIKQFLKNLSKKDYQFDC